MTPHDIIKALAESDPVYETSVSPLTKSFVRKCALCRAVSGHNQLPELRLTEENVRHEALCPWIPAKKLIAMKGQILPKDEAAEPVPGAAHGKK